jgi:hypothetical protein
MNYSNLLQKLGKQGFFDLASVVQVSEEPRQSIQTQLYRWCKKGKLISLRRGMYAIPEPYRSSAINPAELANHLYTPSYLSLWYMTQQPPVCPNLVQFQNALDQTQGTNRVAAKSWSKLVLDTIKHIDVSVLQADVKPFLERPNEASLLSVETFESLLS